MNQIWLKVFAAMLCGSLAKYVFPYQLLWVVIDVVVLGVAFLILRRYAFIDLKKSMLFLTAFTGVSILVDLNIIDGAIGTVVSLGLIAWAMFGSRMPNRPSGRLRHKWHK
jgi:hypothetical protein